MNNNGVNDHLKSFVNQAFSLGYQLEKESIDILKKIDKQQDLQDILTKIFAKLEKLPEKPLFISKELIEDVVKEHMKELNSEKTISSVTKKFKPLSKDFDADIQILFDPTQEISSTGTLDDYLHLFIDRFTQISRVLKERLDVKDAVSIKDALKSTTNSKIKIIGIITNMRERRGNITLQLEDLESEITVIVSSKSRGSVRQKAQKLLLDQIVCIEGIKRNNDLVFAIDIINPDIPDRKPHVAKRSVYAVLLSDLHVGSRQFQSQSFNKFVRWLKGQEGNSRQQSIASRVKYILIAGDLVDGVGVYPNQERELAVTDIFEQYSLAAKYLQQIPEYIKVIIIPGNHDATRQSLPQPAIFKDYAQPIYDSRDVIMLGNPARIRINQVEFLMSHGRSLDDVIGSVPDVMYRNLDDTISIAMRYLLRIRHLAPVYGSRTPIAPEPKDQLVINSVPDIFHAGHVHVLGYEGYRGTLIINSGSWQSQTSFQEKMGLIPTWGIAPIVNLKTLQLFPINFA